MKRRPSLSGLVEKPTQITFEKRVGQNNRCAFEKRRLQRFDKPMRGRKKAPEKFLDRRAWAKKRPDPNSKGQDPTQKPMSARTSGFDSRSRHHAGVTAAAPSRVTARGRSPGCRG